MCRHFALKKVQVVKLRFSVPAAKETTFYFAPNSELVRAKVSPKKKGAVGYCQG